MDKTLLLMLALAATICILGTAGCISNSTTSLSTVQAAGQNPTVSFNATPVKYAQVNGVTLGYREFGSGEPLLMIEGFGATIDDWNETFIGILATNYHVYTYDNRGMGYSSDNNATPTISLYSDDAAAMMTALGYDSMNVYGASMGSSISQQLAIDHPERVRKLILDSNTYSVRIPQTQKLLGTIESVAADPAATPGEQREAQANLVWNGSWAGLSGIHKDVMLVVGTSDVLTPDAVSVQMAGQINGSWLVRFQGLPHTGYLYAPVQYGENALNFLGMNESPLGP
ncbi:alpha/beta fold hydrolase [Methanoregula sp.]|uniref:alpha/beta fold hydrolase n=2 Tax=Methanoregula sp. TaxID=2052170 RepID=UPI003BAF7554